MRCGLWSRHALLAALALTTAARTTAGGAPLNFVDDAGRSVVIPAVVTRVLAAGAPAEVLLYTLAPDKLAARNHAPSDAAKALMPERYRHPAILDQLPSRRNDAADRAFLAFQPDLYVDYGSLDEGYVASLNIVQARTKVPTVLLDGRLERIPETYRRLGQLIGEQRRGDQLGNAATRLLSRYHDKLLGAGRAAPRIYVACAADPLVACTREDAGSEVIRWLGAVNVADDAARDRRVTTAELLRWSPDLIVLSNPTALAALRGDAELAGLPALRDGRIVIWPDAPFSWGAQPPSINRLAGMVWLAGTLGDVQSSRASISDLRRFYKTFYHHAVSAKDIAVLSGKNRAAH